MPRWVALIFVFLGAYIILLSLGVLPYTPPTRGTAIFAGPEHWQISSIGVAFCCAGIAIAFGKQQHWLLILNGMILLPAFAAPVFWGLLFSGRVSLPLQVFGCVVMGLGLAGAVFGLMRTAQGKSTTIILK